MSNGEKNEPRRCVAASIDQRSTNCNATNRVPSGAINKELNASLAGTSCLIVARCFCLLGSQAPFCLPGPLLSSLCKYHRRWGAVGCFCSSHRHRWAKGGKQPRHADCSYNRRGAAHEFCPWAFPSVAQLGTAASLCSSGQAGRLPN